ncbi:MAG: glycosyltransferase family 2 protein [Bacteroidota bacterium]|nr:glycosyltransferase family 2 protein [Bacteroidota bacterium]
MFEKLSVVIINFQTPDLLGTAVESFRAFYPTVDILIVDNGSSDNSLESINNLIVNNPATTLLKFSENIFHGPAMHAAIEETNKDFVFLLDSDTVTIKGLFLEEMLELIQTENNVYCVGRLDKVDKRGFLTNNNGIPAVRTPYMMINRNHYLHFHPFEHRGLPTLKNFTDAHRLGFKFLNFPIENYIHHLGRGTASRFGYKLGIKSKIDFVLHKLGL